MSLANIGEVHLHHQRPVEALPFLERALPIARETRDRLAEATVLADLGRIKAVHRFTGEARAYLQQARALWRELGSHDTAGELSREIEDLDASTG